MHLNIFLRECFFFLSITIWMNCKKAPLLNSECELSPSSQHQTKSRRRNSTNSWWILEFSVNAAGAILFYQRTEMDYELASPGVLCSLSTEELLTKIQEWGLDVTEAEAQRFRGKFYLKKNVA